MSTRSKPQKIPVTERALMQRVNRSLAKHDPPELLVKRRKHRGSYAMFGEYLIVDLKLRCASRTRVDLLTLAREEKVLKDWEEFVR